MKLTEQILFKLSKEDKKTLKALAQASRMSMSAYLRYKIFLGTGVNFDT